jgi:hypothetical protein
MLGGHRVLLNLGQVDVLARVHLNGKDLGVVWKRPFQLDITGAAQSGVNSVTIDVTNLWTNRLIGDTRLPEDKRITWTNLNPYKANSQLSESGLLGPVIIESTEQVTAN